MAELASGVCLLTVHLDGEDRDLGMTVTSLASASLDPPRRGATVGHSDRRSAWPERVTLQPVVVNDGARRICRSRMPLSGTLETGTATAPKRYGAPSLWRVSGHPTRANPRTLPENDASAESLEPEPIPHGGPGSIDTQVQML